MLTHRLESVPTRRLRDPIANLDKYRDEIIRTLDLLFTGF